MPEWVEERLPEVAVIPQVLVCVTNEVFSVVAVVVADSNWDGITVPGQRRDRP